MGDISYMSVVGDVELKVLRYLFSNPKQFIQHIQKGIHAPYVSTYLAVKRLHEKGYVEVADEAKTEKGNLEKRWRLSEKGLAYVIATADDEDVWVLERCPPEYIPTDIIQLMRAWSSYIGKENIRKIIRTGYKIYLSALENGKVKPAEAIHYVPAAVLNWLLTEGEVELDKPLPTKPLDFELLKQILKMWREGVKQLK